MDDHAIVELYWRRDETAIDETRRAYGGYCAAIAGNILADPQDREECLSDTWLGAWNAMPPQRPQKLSPLLGRICRNAALDIHRRLTAGKRSGGFPLVLEELAECVGGAPLEETVTARELGEAISRFLEGIPAVQRRVFLRRYWACQDVAGIARDFSFTESKVKSMLRRTREKLKRTLIEEGYDL